MIDVVDGPLAGAELEDVLDRVEVVERLERHLFPRDGLLELPVDAEAADLAEAVAVRVLELLVEELLRLLELRRVARTQARIDLEQRRFVRVGRIFGERLEDDVILDRAQDRHFADATGHDDIDAVLGELHARVEVDLARLRVDHVADGGLADELGAGILVHLDHFGRVERPQDVGRVGERLVHRSEQGHRRELAGLVDADAHRLLLGDVDLDPAPALGNDATGVLLAVAVGLDDEIDAGAAVELAHDAALGPIDDEFAAADHDRHVAQVDLFLDRLGLLVQPQPDAERPTVGEAELAALVGAEARLAQFVLDVLQGDIAVVALDREDLFENALESRLDPFQRRGVQLEESRERDRLDVRQGRNLRDVAVTTEESNRLRGEDSIGGNGHVVAPPEVTNKQTDPLDGDGIDARLRAARQTVSRRGFVVG